MKNQPDWNIGSKDLAKMTNSQLNKLAEENSKAHSLNTDKAIAAGMGNMKHSEIVAGGSEIGKELEELTRRSQALSYERERRGHSSYPLPKGGARLI